MLRDGVYDAARQTILVEEDKLCTAIVEDSSGLSAAHPSIRGDACYVDGQRDKHRGSDCSAAAIDSRRFCPCSTSGTAAAALLAVSSSSAWSPVAEPTVAPAATNVVTLSVPYFWTSVTNYATVNTVPYSFSVCSAGSIRIADCDYNRCVTSGENQYIRLYLNGEEVASNDDSCGRCSAIDYNVTSDACQTFTLQQGCSWYLQCAGKFTITLTSSGAQNTAGIFSISLLSLKGFSFVISTSTYCPTSAPSQKPAMYPVSYPVASPSIMAAPASSPTELPTIVPSQTPTEAPSAGGWISPSPLSGHVLTAATPLHVPYYSISGTSSAYVNTVPYTFSVCSAGSMLIADCDPTRCLSYYNDQLIRLYIDQYHVAFSDDSCSSCSAIYYYIASDACQTFTLQQGCYLNTQCSGNFTITLDSSASGHDTIFPF